MSDNNPWAIYTWQELIHAHKFYALTLSNPQCNICAQIEHELTERALGNRPAKDEREQVNPIK